MVRTKDKKAKGDEAFKTQKQKIGKKKLAPATATRAEVHARTLRILKPKDEVITPDTINQPRNPNEFLTSKADAANNRTAAGAGGAGWEKHRPDRSLQENLLGAAHYREATRASSFTALNATVDHFAAQISPTQFMQLLNVTLGAVTDTGVDVREKALALFMKLLKLFPPPMTSDGVRHIMTYIRISLTHAQPGVRRSGIKMLGAFARQWPGAIRRAYADVGAAKATGGAAGSAAPAVSSSAALVNESTISQALSTHPFVAVGSDGAAFTGATTTSSFLRTSDGLAHQGGVVSGTAGAYTGNATFISDSNNPKATGGVEVVGIYDTTTRAKTFDIEQILEWATEVASNAPISQQHRMMPVIATLLEEVLPFRAHVVADQSADLGIDSADTDATDGAGATAAAATITLPVAFVDRYFRKFASRWAMQWKELMELGYKMFRDAIVVERITAVGRCFAACTIYLHRHGRLFTAHGYGNIRGMAQQAYNKDGSGVDARWMMRELFLHKVPFTMKELTSGSARTDSKAAGGDGSTSIDSAATSRMTTQDALLRGPLMAPKAAAAMNAVMPSLSKANKKLTDKGPRHLTIVPTARNPQSNANTSNNAKDASQLTVFDALSAVANVSASRLRVAEVIAWCLLPIASDKQEQLKCNNAINGIATAAAANDGDAQQAGSKRQRNGGRNGKKKQARAEEEGGEKKDEGVDEAALGRPDLEADEKDSDAEVDLDANEEDEDEAKGAINAEHIGNTSNNNGNVNSSASAASGKFKGADNVAQAKRLVKTFIESPSCPLASSVQLLRAMLCMYPHLYPTVGMPLLETLLKRTQATVAIVTPISIAAPTKALLAGDLKKEKKGDDSDDSDSDDEEELDENSKAAKERNASAAYGSQCGRDLRDLVGLIATAMQNKYVLMWPGAPSTSSKKNSNAPVAKLPIEVLGQLLRDHVPKTLFSLRNFAVHTSSLPPAHSPAYNNAARRQIAMAYERSTTLSGIMRCAVQTYHDAVTMRHPALYHDFNATSSSAAAADNNTNSDATLKKSLSALVEIRLKRGEGVEDMVMSGPLKALDDPVLVNMAKGTLSYL